jgi:hypothetical protein
MDGALIGKLDAGTKAKGKYELSLNDTRFGLQSRPAGKYVVTLDVNGRTMRKTFILQP